MAEGWRERDLRGDEGRPASVAGVVRHARRGLAAARAGEAVLFGAAALGFGLAAAAWTGAGLERADAWAAAAVCALCAGAAWWGEHRRSAADVARALDRRLRHQGALVTAFEVEDRGVPGSPGPPGSLGRLLVVHVLERLRKREALHALRPGLALPVAAPLAGAAVLAGVLQAVAVEPPPRSVAVVTRGLVGRLGDTLDAAFADESADLELVRALRAAVAEARDLAAELRAAEEAGIAPPPDAARRLEELDRTLADLAGEAGGEPASAADLRAELAEARSWLDALRGGLEPAPDAADLGASTPADAADGIDDATADGTEDPGVAERGGDGTMAGSTSPAGGGEAPSSSSPDDGTSSGGADPPAAGAVETGTVAGTWWPAEHDAIVRRWLDRVRADPR
jgi:hypothetical protein